MHWLLALLIAAESVPSGYRLVPLKIEPPQKLKAISIRGGDTVVPVDVRDGAALIPSALPLPWTVSMVRFEATSFTREDIDRGRPLLVRELGSVTGVLQRSRGDRSSKFVFLMLRAGDHAADEFEVTLGNDDRFRFDLPAGTWQGAALGEASATRIRPAIVIAAGKQTDIGGLIAEPATRASIRVVDGANGKPIAGATVTWSPTNAINADIARILYARRWSAVTNSRGMATIASIGPPPIPLRWLIEAAGYTTAPTAAALLREPQPLTIPDVRLHVNPSVIIRLRLPHDHPEQFRGGQMVVGEPDEDNANRFHAAWTAPIHEGESKYAPRSFGPKRLWIDSTSGSALFYRDFEVNSATTLLDVALVPVDIHGSVSRSGEPVEHAIIRVADPHDATKVMGIATTDSHGLYRLTTYQRGKLFLYAIGESRITSQSGSLNRELQTDDQTSDYQVDFELASSGAAVKVIDAVDGTPLKAQIDKEITNRSGGKQVGRAATDEGGRFALNGFPEGTARLFISAPGHVGREVELPLTPDATETTVALDRSSPVSGQVIDANGTPVVGARISGVYNDEMGLHPNYQSSTDASGRFTFDSAPPPGTVFYVAAGGYSLGITMVVPGRENTITLSPVGRATVVVLPDNAPPTKFHRITAAPVDGDIIPLGALQQVSEMNGLNLFQLAGTARDGTVALPEFLPPGSYKLFVMSLGNHGWEYHPIGTITLPASQNKVISYKER